MPGDEIGDGYGPPTVREAAVLWSPAAGEMTKTTPAQGVVGRILRRPCLLLIDRGAGHVTDADGRTHPVAAGQAVLLPPDLRHGYRADPSWHEWWLIVDGPGVAQLMDEGLFVPSRPVMDIHDMSEAILLCRQVLRSFTLGSAGRWINSGAVRHLMGLLLAAGPRHRVDPLVAMARQVIAERACAGLTPPALARLLGVPHATLRRRFRIATGQGINEAITAARLGRAAALLAAGDIPIQEVAALCGYDDPLYFSRRFRAVMGRPPSHWRLGHEDGV